MPQPPQTIDAMYAWVSTDPDGGEGIAALRIGDARYPMVGADMERMRSLRPYAETLRTTTGCPVRLVRFSMREDLEELP